MDNEKIPVTVGEAFDSLGNISGDALTVVLEDAERRSVSPSAPLVLSTLTAVLESRGYRRESEALWMDTIGEGQLTDAFLRMWTIRRYADQFLALSLAVGLFSIPRFERTRQLYGFPAHLQRSVLNRFEDIRNMEKPPPQVAKWAMRVRLSWERELHIAERLVAFAFFAALIAYKAPRHLRALLAHANIEESLIVRKLRPPEDDVLRWFEASLRLLPEEGCDE